MKGKKMHKGIQPQVFELYGLPGKDIYSKSVDYWDSQKDELGRECEDYTSSMLWVVGVSFKQAFGFACNGCWAIGPKFPDCLGIVEWYCEERGDPGDLQQWDTYRCYNSDEAALNLDHHDSLVLVEAAMRRHLDTVIERGMKDIRSERFGFHPQPPPPPKDKYLSPMEKYLATHGPWDVSMVPQKDMPSPTPLRKLSWKDGPDISIPTVADLTKENMSPTKVTWGRYAMEEEEGT